MHFNQKGETLFAKTLRCFRAQKAQGNDFFSRKVNFAPQKSFLVAAKPPLRIRAEREAERLGVIASELSERGNPYLRSGDVHVATHPRFPRRSAL